MLTLPAAMPSFWLPDAPPAIANPLAEALTRPLGFHPAVSVKLQPAEETYILPCNFEFGLFEKEALSQQLAELRREHEGASFFHDDVNLGHPLVAQTFADQAGRALAGKSVSPERLGVLLVAQGRGDASSRAQVYQLMRLLWEQLGAARGEVAFLRNPTPFLRAELERLDPLVWVVVPLLWEPSEPLEHLRTIVDDHVRNRPDVSGMFHVAEPPGAHPALIGWLAQRALELWRGRRQQETGRVRSLKRERPSAARRIGAIDTGLAADVRNAAELRAILPASILDAESVFVKVTWHGYATGTYTDPAALDALLEAIPGKVVLLEGHTSSRSSAGRVEWDWETEARERRVWIREQEREFLEKTGLAEVIRRRGAAYVNVTEELWDGRCAAPDGFPADVEFPELAGFVPQILADHAGAPLISYARFKGPTRLSLSNLFGLIPEPLRARWHGPNLSYVAKVCCALAKLYGSFLNLYGLNESINAAVRWDRRGLYRSRWGNYDLIAAPGLATISRGVTGADALAARLQGGDPARSAYYDVVRAELGIPAAAETVELPEDWLRRFA